MFAFVSLLALAAASSQAPAHQPARHKVPEPIGSLQGLITADDYPSEALAHNEQGRVGVLIKVDSTGAVSDCIVEKPVSASLDQRTCELIRSRAKFKAPKDRHGNPIPSEMHQTVVWHIVDNMMMPSEPWTSRVVIDFGPDGRAKSCRLEVTGALQPKAGQPLPSCPRSVFDRDVSAETRFGGAIDKTIDEQRFEVGPRAADAPGTGEMIAGRNVMKLDIDASGRLSACKTIEKIGITAVPDACPTIGHHYSPPKGPDGKTAPIEATMTITTFVHLDGKRMPLTGSLQGLIRPEDYPAEALDKNQQGAVTLHLRVDPTGSVSECLIDKSSGFPLLDKKSCEVVKARAHFQPARDREGRPIASENYSRIVWAIADDTTPSDPWVSRMIVVFDSKGRQLSCRMELEGAMRPEHGEPAPACDAQAVPQAPNLARVAPDAVATVVLEQRFALDNSSSPPIGQGDTLISREAVDLDIDARGKVTSCKVVEHGGYGPQADVCDGFDQDFVARKGPNGNAVPFKARETITAYLHVEKVT